MTRQLAWFVALTACAPTPHTWRDAVPRPSPNAVLDVPTPSPRECSASFGAEDEWKAWTSPEIRRSLEARLSALHDCGKTLQASARVSVGVKLGAAKVDQVDVRESTTDDCRALECLRQGLLALDVSSLPDHAGRTLASFVELSHDAPPRISVEGIPSHEARSAACIDAASTRTGHMANERDIPTVMHSHLPGFRRCYDAAVEGESKREHTATMDYWIGADGHIQSAVVITKGFADCQIATCLRDELARAIFPKPEGGGVHTTNMLRFDAPDDRTTPSTMAVPPIPPDDPDQCIDPRAAPANGAAEKELAGRLPPEVIQSIVRQSYPRFRHCFESGLARNARLSDEVAVRFVIGEDGTVTTLSVERNTLPDCEVARCVRDEYRNIRFPAPQGGPVVVVYPIMLEPG